MREYARSSGTKARRSSILFRCLRRAAICRFDKAVQPSKRVHLSDDAPETISCECSQFVQGLRHDLPKVHEHLIAD